MSPAAPSPPGSSSPRSSGSPDPDLRDVFRLLYAEGGWSDDESEDESLSSTPSLESDSTVTPPQPPPPPPPPVYSKRHNKRKMLDDIDALVNNAASRRRIYKPVAQWNSLFFVPGTMPFTDSPPAEEYMPYSLLSLLSRLRTYELALHSQHLPVSLSPVKAALKGWVNWGRNTFRCAECEAVWTADGVEDIEDVKVREKVAERLARGFEEAHLPHCAWRLHSTPDDWYDRLRKFAHPPMSTHLVPISSRLSLEVPTLYGIPYTCPITRGQEKRLANYMEIISPKMAISTPHSTIALFGWYPYHSHEEHVSIDTSKRLIRTSFVTCKMCLRRVAVDTVGMPGGKAKFDLVNEHLGWCPIRQQPWEDKLWWEESGLLEKRAGWPEKGRVKGSFPLSDKIVKRPWRR
ncbi:hypothetical protein IAT38_002228 [Cryptococcus sp. DSM 104549]